MRVILQRVDSASVSIGGNDIGRIAKGFLLLLGVGEGDTSEDVSRLCDKISGLRIFPNQEGKLQYSLAEVNGSILLVSNFTLYADCRKGRRPSFTDAANPPKAQRLYLDMAEEFRKKGFFVAMGEFGASMQVTLQNDGPFTLFLDSKQWKGEKSQ